jgi:hypothetical protein
MDLSTISADLILKIPETSPENLYSNDSDKAKSEYHTLSKRFHPDTDLLNPKLHDVFRHIKKLYDVALVKIKTATWETPFKYQLHVAGKVMQRAYRVKHKFELGTMYVGDIAVTYVVKPEFEHLFNNAVEIINGLKYPTEDIKKQIRPIMPNIETSFKADEGLVLVIRKSPDFLLLRDVLTYRNFLDIKQVAWIYGRLCNICCYLHLATSVNHNAISPETIFVDTVTHQVALLGGWWYASNNVKKQLLGLPEYSVLHGYPSIMRTKMPDQKNDLTLSKAVARDALGDVYGSKLRHNSAIPKSLIEWFNTPTGGSAQKEFVAWEKVRDTAFGPRKFVRMEVTAKELYPESFLG